MRGILENQYINPNTMEIVDGWECINKFGHSALIGTEFSMVWPPGNGYTWPTTAEPMRIKAGGDANDILGGSGAEKVNFIGLDDNWLEASEEVDTNGIDESEPTETLFSRVFRARCSQIGTYGGSNIGNIEIENVTSEQVVAYISADEGNTLMALYTVPANRQGYVRRRAPGFAANKNVDIRMLTRKNANVVSGAMSPVLTGYLLHDETGVEGDLPVMVPLSPYEDVWYEARISQGSTAILVEFDILLAAS